MSHYTSSGLCNVLWHKWDLQPLPQTGNVDQIQHSQMQLCPSTVEETYNYSVVPSACIWTSAVWLRFTFKANFYQSCTTNEVYFWGCFRLWRPWRVKVRERANFTSTRVYVPTSTSSTVCEYVCIRMSACVSYAIRYFVGWWKARPHRSSVFLN